MRIPAVALIVIWSLAATSMAAVARQDAATIRTDLRDTYNFRPQLLSDQQITERSKTLDALWERAKAQRDAYVSVLREELRNYGNSSIYLYDGSMLLLNLSDTVFDRQLAVAAIAHCDLRDIQATDYLRKVHGLAAEGIDVTAAALHILTSPRFTAFIPQHALKLGQDYSLVVMLLPMPVDTWLGSAIDRLDVETNPTSQRTLLLAIWYAQTDEADKALTTFAGSAAKPAASRAYARELLGRNQKIAATSTQPPAESEASLRSSRQTTMKRVISDEALLELDQQTILLIAKRKARL